MKIKDRVVEKCGECGTVKREIAPEMFGCDQCKKPISFDSNGKSHHDFLQISVFPKGGGSNAKHSEFCSWECLVKRLKSMKHNYEFVSMPFLYKGKDVLPGQSVTDLLKLFR